MEDRVTITDELAVSQGELTYKATRSGGPGGQHVNTSATRIELTWNVAASPALTEEQRSRIRAKLANRIDEDGVLHLTASSRRSQLQNREEVTERFARLVAAALAVPKPRKRTRPTKASKEARLRSKKRQSDRKRMRGRIESDE